MANHIIITGRITNDLELKESGETKILNFSVAVQRKYKNKDGEYDTDFIRCVAFNNSANFIAKYFSKGKPILIEGTLQQNDYEKDGEKRTTYNVVVEKTDFFATSNTNTVTVDNNINDFNVNVVTDSEDDLPF